MLCKEDVKQAIILLYYVILIRDNEPADKEVASHIGAGNWTRCFIVQKIKQFYSSAERLRKLSEGKVPKRNPLLFYNIEAMYNNLYRFLVDAQLKHEDQQWVRLLMAEWAFLTLDYKSFLSIHDSIDVDQQKHLEYAKRVVDAHLLRLLSGSYVAIPPKEVDKIEDLYLQEGPAYFINQYNARNSSSQGVELTYTAPIEVYYKGSFDLAISLDYNISIGKVLSLKLNDTSGEYSIVACKGQPNVFIHRLDHADQVEKLVVELSEAGLYKINADIKLTFGFHGDAEKSSAVKGVRVKTNNRFDHFVFAYQVNALKQKHTMQPVYEKLKEKGVRCSFLPIDSQVDQKKLSDPIFVISAPEAYDLLIDKYPGAKYIFMEHGAAPVKRYSYRPHYCRYELLLMPGALWVERLKYLYPGVFEDDNLKVVGYSKVNKPEDENVKFTKEEWCALIGLNPRKPIILFAPTWSGGDASAGIFNIKYLAGMENVLTFPHGDDVRFIPDLVKRGCEIITPPREAYESISDIYPYVDILVSDISSTAVEFAARGGKSVCIIPEVIKDFDYDCIEGDAIKIAYTDSYWDFCPVVRPEKLQEMLSAIINGSDDGFYDYGKVKSILDCIGRDSVDKIVSEILSFPVR
ncbi:hypothetical protein [Chromohalobacter japonicus]|uniref:hypothetical protein n=1 Tax=Chromohalobacter japonicus TaxID=223900 RepID=UPI00058CA489|nr:hypothetical protein [Chromohalobacter japonicus]